MKTKKLEFDGMVSKDDWIETIKKEIKFEKLKQCVMNLCNDDTIICSFGNKTLYDMCCNDLKIGEKYEDKAAFGDKLWIIGRAYAASPERRFSKKNDENDKYNETRGDGTGTYFTEVAKSIAATEDYNTLVEKYKGSLESYKFDFGEEDLEKLAKGIECVWWFNKLIVEAAKNFDKSKNQNQGSTYKNQISFCSKFLHFHFPNCIFIIDHYAKEGGKWFFSEKRSDAVLKTICPEKYEESNEFDLDNKIECIGGKKSAYVNLFLTKICKCYAQENDIVSAWNSVDNRESTKETNNIKEYAEHCVRSYLLGCLISSSDEIKDIVVQKKIYYPRLTDSIFLRIKKK